MKDEPPLEVKAALVQQRIAQWQNSRYQLATDYRVQQRVGTPLEILEPLEAEIARCERMIAGYREVLEELGGEHEC